MALLLSDVFANLATQDLTVARLSDELAREQGRTVSVIALRPDGEGSEGAFSTLAEVTLSVCRATDLPGHWGNGTLVLVVPDAKASDAVRVAHRVQRALDARAPQLKASAGVAERNPLRTSAYAMVRAAEWALEQTRARTRGGVGLADDGVGVTTCDRTFDAPPPWAMALGARAQR